MRRHFGELDFEGIKVTPPTPTFTGRLDMTVGDRRIELIESRAGAHRPVRWRASDHVDGAVQNWIAACDRLTATGAAYVVPGHGPVTDLAKVAEFRGYLEWVAERAEKAYAGGLPYWEAGDPAVIPALDAGWDNPERLVITMAAAYRGLGGDSYDLLEVLAHAAQAEPKR